MNEIVGEHGVHPGQIAQWKRQVLEELPGLFSSKRSREAKDQEELKASLYQQIGQLKVELDWLNSEGHEVNHKRVARLMETMGLQTIYPGPRTSQPSPKHRIYPYLLRDV